MQIYEASFEQARFWIPDLLPVMRHCCGAKRFGFQALLLDRSENPSVVAYQDWLEAPEYEGKTVEEVQGNTIASLDVVASMLRHRKQ